MRAGEHTPTTVDASSGATNASNNTVLTKPERPHVPKAPDLRDVKDAAKRKAKQDAYDAAHEEYLCKMKVYEPKYAAYRAAKKKAARPSDDGARAVKRRQQNLSAASNHRVREGNAYRAELQLKVVSDLKHSLQRGAPARDPHGFEGADDIAFIRAWDRHALQALIAWADAVPPDGSQDWWAHLWGVARVVPKGSGVLRAVGFSAGSKQYSTFAAGAMPPPTQLLPDEWLTLTRTAGVEQPPAFANNTVKPHTATARATQTHSSVPVRATESAGNDRVHIVAGVRPTYAAHLRSRAGSFAIDPPKM